MNGSKGGCSALFLLYVDRSVSQSRLYQLVKVGYHMSPWIGKQTIVALPFFGQRSIGLFFFLPLISLKNINTACCSSPFGLLQTCELALLNLCVCLPGSCLFLQAKEHNLLLYLLFCFPIRIQVNKLIIV